MYKELQTLFEMHSERITYLDCHLYQSQLFSSRPDKFQRGIGLSPICQNYQSPVT